MKISVGTVVAITGASRGIGREAALQFARRGATIFLMARDEKRLQNVAREVEQAGGKALIQVCDVSVEAECMAAMRRIDHELGRIDVLVNNAGFGHYASVSRLETKDLERVFGTNVYGAFWCAKEAVRRMKEQKRGHIVNVSSVIGIRSMPFMTAYCMSKFALHALDEGLRLEVKDYGIGVSLVCPGLTKTDFQTNAAHVNYTPPVTSSVGGMSPERVGKKIYEAVVKNKRLTSLTFSGRTMIFLNKISAHLVDQILHFIVMRDAKKKGYAA